MSTVTGASTDSYTDVKEYASTAVRRLDLTTQTVKQVLVVDDEPVVRTLVSEIVGQEGHEATQAEDGSEAIELLQRTEFDLVITDLVMPNANGVEVIRAAKEIDPTYPIIMITAYPSLDTVRKMIALGAADYIVKPFNVDHVRLTMAKVLEMRNQFATLMKSQSVFATPAIDTTGAFTGEVFKRLIESEVGRAEYHKKVFTLLNISVHRFHAKVARPDTLRKRFADLLVEAGRPGDMIGRTGKDDFTILLPESKREVAEMLFQRIDQSTGVWTLTYGTATYGDDSNSAEGLLAVARNAAKFAEDALKHEYTPPESPQRQTKV